MMPNTMLTMRYFAGGEEIPHISLMWLCSKGATKTVKIICFGWNFLTCIIFSLSKDFQ